MALRDHDFGFATTGSWTTSTSTTSGDYYGADWLWAAAGSGANSVTWTPTIAVSGTYDVYASWTTSTSRASDATCSIAPRGADHKRAVFVAQIHGDAVDLGLHGPIQR